MIMGGRVIRSFSEVVLYIRCAPNSAVLQGLKIGYGTRRLEGLTELHWSRQRVPLEQSFFLTLGGEKHSKR